MKNITRKKCLEDTGYTPEQISNIARTHPALDRINVEMGENKNATHEAKVRWVYAGLKHQRQKMLGLDKNQTKLEVKFEKASDLTHNCTGSSACFGCERERRNAYANGGNYYG